MTEQYQTQLQKLAKELVTPQRFSEVQRVAELATVSAMYPDLPQAAVYYFPDRSGE